MGRNLGIILQEELENLDKDSDSRKLAMKALKSYVKDMDKTAIPIFLARVSETKETNSSSCEYTISLYEVLARVHGPNIVPQIDNIMCTIIKTLNSSAGSFALHQACSKVVPAIARYAIEPTTPADKKRYIVHSLCKPLSGSLLGSHESLSAGAALCLKALVDTDNWRFASNDMVNEVCLNTASALEEKALQTNSHMGLVMALAKHNPLTVEAYARLLLHSGLRILTTGVVEGNSQRRLSAIQMVNFLMKCLDPRSFYSELELIIEEMEKCQDDQMAFVKGAAFEALQTAKRIASEKGSKLEKEFSSSNSSRRRNTSYSGDQSPLTTSPESQTLSSFAEYDCFVESPISSSYEYERRSVNRKLWNGGVDISLKDGLFTDVNTSSSLSNRTTQHFVQFEHPDIREDPTQKFSGFYQRSPRNGHLRSNTPSPQRSCSRGNFDNIEIFTTPRKLVRSLQDQNDFDTSSDKRRQYKSPSKFEWTPTTRYSQNSFEHDEIQTTQNPSHSCGQQQLSIGSGSESVSSSEDVPAYTQPEVSHEMIKAEIPVSSTEKHERKAAVKLLCCFFALVALFASLLLLGDRDEEDYYYITPT